MLLHLALGNLPFDVLPNGRVLVTLPATRLPFGASIRATALDPSPRVFLAAMRRCRSASLPVPAGRDGIGSPEWADRVSLADPRHATLRGELGLPLEAPVELTGALDEPDEPPL